VEVFKYFVKFVLMRTVLMYGFADRVGQEGGHIPEGELS
jgi:hypothetical protein